MKQWQLQTAKARMSELVKLAQDRPQEITLHGRAAAVVLSKQEFDRLSKGNISLVEFMRNSPLFGEDDIDLERQQSNTRDISL